LLGSRKGLLALGIILVLIGLSITFYRESNVIFDIEEYHRTYPYAYIGMILFLAGVLSLILGILYSFGKQKEMPSTKKIGDKLSS